MDVLDGLLEREAPLESSLKGFLWAFALKQTGLSAANTRAVFRNRDHIVLRKSCQGVYAKYTAAVQPGVVQQSASILLTSGYTQCISSIRGR